jgi:trimethylamine--corrinoid protein Co-methyltransferase
VSQISSPPRRGRENRLARARTQAAKYPYIRRKLPVVELLSSEAVEIIEANAETILEEIGIEFRRDPESLRLWRGAGADVQGERVHIPRGLARHLLQSAPREFILHARNPDRSVRFGGDATVFSPVGGPPFVYDIERGRRYGTLEDLQNFIKLAHMAPAIHFSGGCMCEPMEIPPNKRHLDVQYSFFRYSDQGCEATPETPGHARDAIALARVLFGAEYLETHPVVLGNINSNSPLTFDGRMLGALREFAGANQGTIIVPAVLAGAMGPVTAAGCLSEILAETLAGMALTQIVRPGAPVILGSFVGDVRHARGDADDLRNRPARPAHRRAVPQRRIVVLLQDRRCAGGLRKRTYAAADVAGRRQPGHPCGRLARGRARGRLREVRDGRGSACHDAEPLAGNGSVGARTGAGGDP